MKLYTVMLHGSLEKKLLSEMECEYNAATGVRAFV